MSEQMPFLVPPYAALAEVYDRAGYADYARRMTPVCIEYAQSLDWAGRRVLDLGCGTGETCWFLAGQGYRVAGIDASLSMLNQAQIERESAAGFAPPEFVHMDMRQFESPLGPADLVLSFGGSLNAILGLNELQAVFGRVNKALDPGKLFIFDMHTIQGLAHIGRAGDTVDADDPGDLTLVVRNQFDYEMLSLTRHMMIWRREDEVWHRRDEVHVERGFPVKAVEAMLERTGFALSATLTPDMEPFDPARDTWGRVLFVAQKQPASG